MADTRIPHRDKNLVEVQDHYAVGKDERDRRKTRHNGWDDVLRAYYGRLSTDWPYISKVVDPVLKTTLIEKNSRLLNGKLKGTLAPREGGDIVGAKINNAILDFQWDQANEGGTMLEKWALMDLQTRLFGASFALVFWQTIDETDGTPGYEGNDMLVLDNRDVFFDQSAQTVQDANWIQVTRWMTFDQIEKEWGKQAELKRRLSLETDSSFMGDRRDNEYTSIIKQEHGIEDKVGHDKVYPRVEMVTEYRHDNWITFAPRYGLIVDDVDNPRDDKLLPIVKLTYYPTGDDMYGDIEVESVLPIQRAINALLCGFIDTMNIGMRPPIKIANNAQARIDTFNYGPDAQWLVGDSVNNVQIFQTGGQQAINNFQNSYSALKSAFNVAMGETSTGVSNIDPFGADKTATEIKANEQQKFTRDQKNQLHLEIALKAQMMLWLASNRQFLLADKTKQLLVQRVVGKEMLEDLKDLGLADMEAPNEAFEAVSSIIADSGGAIEDSQMEEMLRQTELPRFPVIKNPNEKDPSQFDIVPKLELDENGGFGSLNVTEDDFGGFYDYIPSIQSLAVAETDRQIEGRSRALELMLNPAVAQMLQAEGKRANISSTLEQVLEDSGIKNAERLFEDLQPQAEVESPLEGTTGAQEGIQPPLPAIPSVGGQANLG